MKVEYYNQGVSFIVRYREGGVAWPSKVVLFDVAKDGWISTRTVDDAITLSELEVGEWHPIGPEDNELFVTEEWWNRLGLDAIFRLDVMNRGWDSHELG